MLSDGKTFFSKNHGWMAGMGDRTGRWAMVIEKDGSISYAENEQSPANVDVSLGTVVTIVNLTDNYTGFQRRGRPRQVVRRQEWECRDKLCCRFGWSSSKPKQDVFSLLSRFGAEQTP